jgi:hypothetical protein
MSGLEIAGLALAVLPVLIAAADAYKASRLDQKSKEFFVNLSYEVTILNFNIQKLASSLVGLPDTLRKKLLYPQSPEELERSWGLPAVVDALRARLDAGADAFLLTLCCIMELLNELLDSPSLDLIGNDLVSFRSHDMNANR